MKNVLKKTILAASALAVSACAQHGTLITYKTDATRVVRAADQEILSQAIDSAFTSVKVAQLRSSIKKFKHRPTMKMVAPPAPPPFVPPPAAVDGEPVAAPAPAPRPKPVIVSVPKRDTMSAYVEVVSPLGLAPATVNYIHQRASVVAAQLGLRVIEVNQRRFVIGGNQPTAVVDKIYPDADARVVVIVSHAGVDDYQNIELQTAHGDTVNPERILKGRFKATLAVTPRQAEFSAIVTTLKGESKYEVNNGKYIDAR